MKKIEEVARAIGGNVWDAASDRMRDQFRAQARDAIEAMREPDDAMRKAVNDLYRDHARGRLEKPDADEIWPVMIDAALNEGKE